MSADEFEKIWRLLQSLWPAAAAKKSNVDIAVWKKGLESYRMSDVSDSIMAYAQSNKFFPDLADITRNLLSESVPDAEAAIIRTAKLYARIIRMEAPEFRTKAEAMDWFHGLQKGRTA